MNLKKTIKAFQRGGGKGKPVYIKLDISYHRDEEKALKGAYKPWKPHVFANYITTNLRYPYQFAEISKNLDPEIMYDEMNISTDLDDYL